MTWRRLGWLLMLLWVAPVWAQAPPRDEREPPPAATAFTLLGAPPGVEVVVDGESVGQTPLGPAKSVAAGPHRLKLSKRGFAPFERDFTAFAGRTVSLEVDLVPTHMVLRLRASAAGAQVYVDDELRGEAPIELELRPGPHQVLLKSANYQDQVLSLSAVAGEEVERDIQLVLKPEQRLKEQAARPKERRYYNRWWVWTLATIGAVGLASAIIIPTVLSQRSSCDKLGAEVCFPIELTAPAALTSSLTIRF